MRLRTILIGATLLLASLAAGRAEAQEHPAQRLASMVGVAVEEYRLAVDERGRLVNRIEYTEAVDFLVDAGQVARRLGGDRAAAARAVLDTLAAAVNARELPATVVALHERFTAALGADGALELPGAPIDLAEGRTLYAQQCASCHGERGLGDGALAAGMDPAPPAIGTREVMSSVSPATAYRVVSVGIKGTAMPGFGETLTSEQRWNVVSYITALRASEAERLEGEGLFLQRCASCHGPEGAGDGVLADALTQVPAHIGAFAWQAERTDEQLAETIRAGIPGSAMPPSLQLTSDQLDRVVAYVRSLSVRSGAVPSLAAGAAPASAQAASRNVIRLLEQALAEARAGRADAAQDRAFDAYIAFEPLETPARAKSPGLVATLEGRFASFKGALRAGDLRAAERERDAIEAGLPGIVDLTGSPSGGWSAFFASLLIILREGLEAILVIGAVVTFLIKTGQRSQLRAVWIGVGLALAASAVTAVILQTILRAMPATREVIEGITMLIAVVVLFSVSYWLISKIEAAKWQRFIREKVSKALERGGGKALVAVAFLAVYREGAETALFYQALITGDGSPLIPILVGLALGAAILAVVFFFVYRFGVRLPLRPLFAVTSVLLYYMAFVFAGKGIRELQEGSVIPITVVPGMPHVEVLGLYPYLETLLAQLLLLLLFVFAVVKTFWPSRREQTDEVARPLAERVDELRDTTARLQARVAVLEDALAAEQRRAGRGL